MSTASAFSGETYNTRQRRFGSAGGGNLDPDTGVAPGSWETALATAGAGLAAVDALAAGAAHAAFVGARTVIPCHYNTFPLIETDAQAFKSAVESATGSKVVVVDPGETHSA